jgi:O-antigen ligase
MNAVFPSLYLFFLYIAPQIWFKPMLNAKTDYFIFPVWMVYSAFSGKSLNLQIDAQVKFLLLFVSWIFVSMVINHVPLDYNDLHLQYLRIIIVFFLFYVSFNSIAQVRVFLGALLILTLALSIEGIEHYTGSSGLGWANQPLGWAAFGLKGRTKWVGIFDGPGVFCVVYTIGLPFLLLLIQQKKLYKTIGLLASTLVIVAIYYNGSRGGFLTTIAIAGMVFGMNYYKKNKPKCLIGIGLVILAYLLAPSSLTNFNDGQNSTSNRIDMWAEGSEMVIQNPVFGIGRGRFQSYSGSLIAHNSAIETMGETGAVGLFLWVGMIYFSLLKLYYFLKDDSLADSLKNTILARGLLISIIGYIISSMFVTLEYETFYMLLGLCGFFGRQLSEKIEMDKYHFKNIFLMTFGWIILIKIFVTLIGPEAFS